VAVSTRLGSFVARPKYRGKLGRSSEVYVYLVSLILCLNFCIFKHIPNGQSSKVNGIESKLVVFFLREAQVYQYNENNVIHA
jgi:hypothetical protein